MRGIAIGLAFTGVTGAGTLVTLLSQIISWHVKGVRRWLNFYKARREW